jgi:hypothetical protein
MGMAPGTGWGAGAGILPWGGGNGMGGYWGATGGMNPMAMQQDWMNSNMGMQADWMAQQQALMGQVGYNMAGMGGMGMGGMGMGGMFGGVPFMPGNMGFGLSAGFGFGF